MVYWRKHGIYMKEVYTMDHDLKSDMPPDSGHIRNEFVAVERYLCREKLHLDNMLSHAVLIVESGMGMLTINSRKYPVSAGRCYYALPSMPVTLEPYFNEVSVIAVHLERLADRERIADSIRYTREYGGFAEWGELEAPTADRLLQLAKEMVQACKKSGQLASAYRDKIFHEWMYELAQANTGQEGKENGNEAMIRRIMRFVDLHYHEELNRNSLAQMAGFSPEYFSVLFKQISGKSLTDYITALRIQHMKERLLFDDIRLSDVAKEVGYKDEYYVSRRFKLEVGMSPTRYVQSSKRIVSLNPHLTMHLLALGIVPAATTAFPWGFGEYEALLHNAGCLCREWTTDFTLQELSALRPDLIIGIDNLEQSRLQDCRRLAPTFVVPWYLTDWRGHFHMLAKITRRTMQEREWTEQFERQLASVRQSLQTSGQLDQTAAIVNIREKTAFLYLNRGMGSQVVYSELNWSPPSSVRKSAVDRAAAAVDLAAVLPHFKADRMIVITEPTPLAESRTEAMLAGEHWESYRQKGGQIHRAAMSRWHGYDPLSIMWQLADVKQWIR